MCLFIDAPQYLNGTKQYCTILKIQWNPAFQTLHTKAARIFQHIYLMYANDLAMLNEGTINHFNDALF